MTAFAWMSSKQKRACARQHLSMVLALLLLCVFVPHVSHAAEAKVTQIEPRVVQGQLNLDVDFSLELNRVMIDALERGVPLYFTVDIEIGQSRWWWFDHKVVETSLIRRLTYNTLTRQWRLAAGDLGIPMVSFKEGLAALQQLRDWPIAPIDRFDPNVKYDGKVRIRLDNSQLARPLQIDALNRGAWLLTSEWAPFDFSVRTYEYRK
jgi:hypothetical protein